MGRVEGKKAFVTGGAQGLGRASAMMLAKEGALVTLADIRGEVPGLTVARPTLDRARKAVGLG